MQGVFLKFPKVELWRKKIKKKNPQEMRQLQKKTSDKKKKNLIFTTSIQWQK